MDKINAQQILYNNNDELDIAITTLLKLPGLINKQDISLFGKDMFQVAANNKFLLHIGDCAELFENSNTKYLSLQLKLFNDAAKLMESLLQKPVCFIGRIAGQYAKPRSNRTEKYKTKELISYYGDIVNSYRPTIKNRLPDPNRMILAYVYSKKTYVYINQMERYYKRKFYISHESLLLPYEKAFTKKYNDKLYNTSCHFPWVGMRTAFLESVHIEYLRGIQNPVAIKLGSNMSYQKILALANILNPLNISGRLTFIYRFGVDLIEQQLAYLIGIVKEHKLNVILCCDPMHGNTKNDNGAKVRKIPDILQELKIALNLHKKYGINLGGIHLEASGDDIEECVDHVSNINPKKYKTKVDPRLNYNQVMKILNEVFVIKY
jgi:3-deoxy-7-phosphoheptulonate synthase